MRKLSPEIFFSTQFIIYNLIVLENYFTSLDPYGLLVGLYFDKIIIFPGNLLVTIILIALTILVGYFVYYLAKDTKIGQYSQFLGHISSCLIFVTTVYSKFTVSILYFTSIMLFALKTYLSIENSEKKSIEIIKSHEKFLIIYATTLLSLTIFNYFFYQFFYIYPNPVGDIGVNFTPWILIITDSVNPITDPRSITELPAPYVSLGNYYLYFKTGLVLAVVFLGVVLATLILSIWYRMNEIIELKNKETDIWVINHHENISFQQANFASSNFDKLKKIDILIENRLNSDLIYEIAEFLEIDLGLLFSGDNQSLPTDKPNNNSIELELLNNSKKLSSLLGLENIIPDIVHKEGILLAHKDKMKLLENAMIPRDDKLIPINNFFSVIRFDETPRIPFKTGSRLKVLHILDHDWHVQLLNRKIIQLFSHHNVEYEIINFEKKYNLDKINQIEYDIVIISLHGMIKENQFMYRIKSNSLNKVDYIDPIQMWDELSIESKIIILPTCQTFDTKFTNKILESNQTSLIISSNTNVLPSHLNMIVLPTIEHFLEERNQTLYDIANLYQKIRKIVDKFGYPTQWSQFRFITGVEIH